MGRKEITKQGFVRLCFWIIGIGLALTITFSTLFLIDGNVQVWQDNSLTLALWGIGLIAVGFGMGMANSRMWKIKDYD